MADELTPGELDRFSHTMAREVAKLIYRVGTVRGGDSQGTWWCERRYWWRR